MKKTKLILVVIILISISSGLIFNFSIVNESNARNKTDVTKNWDRDLKVNPLTSGIIMIFEDDFESGLSKWNSITGLWHLTDTGSAWPDPCHSPTHSMWFGHESTGDYDPTGMGSLERGNLTSIPIDLSSVNNAYLQFYHWKTTEGSGSYDHTYVYITTDNITWVPLYTYWINVAPWEELTFDISSYCGNSSVRIRFFFDTVDALFNNYRGWLVDDVKILGSTNINPPGLTLGSVLPTTGDQSTLFTYTVNYTDLDNSWPVYVNVSINGTSYSMYKQNPSDFNYTNGCIYEFLIYFQEPGIYNYFFECWDGIFYNSTSLTYNPVVSYTNLVGPSLSNGQVNPGIGWKGTTIFVFSVEYTDTDNNEPQFINVTINSTTYPMYKQNPLDSNFMDGCWYDGNTVFDENGTYSYHFNCTDGEFAASDGPHVGPIVRPNNLRNYSMIVGHPYNWINTTTGTELLLDDNGYSTQDLPFNFTYYNETYSTIYLGANGYLSFTDSTPSDGSNDPIPSMDADNEYLIAPFWDDLYTLFAGGNGTVYVQNFTDYWITAWFDIEHDDGNYIGTFEVILYENGDIIFNYDLINYTDGGYTCGLNGLVLDAQTRYFNSYQKMNASDAPIDDFSILFTPNPPKNPYIIINSGDNHTDSTLVSLAVSAFGAEEMCFRNSTSGTWTSWEPYTTIKQFYLENSTINTTSGIYVKFRNLRGESAAAYDDIIYLIFHPGQLSIVINNGDASTNSTLVTLTLLAGGAEEMCFRNGTTGTWTAWEAYSTTKQLYLAGSINNTVYTICAKFQNATGESYAICDNILYLEGITPAGPIISGYSFEWLAISLVGVIGIILLSNKKRRPKLKN